MGRNLPDRVSITADDAPWNQDYPDPSDIHIHCQDCDWSGTVVESDYDGVPYCPDCGGDTEQR